MDRFFRTLADRTRLRLLNIMGEREVCVCYFIEILQLSQPKISRHLAYLRRAGMVAARREGKWMHYRIAVPRDPIAASILSNTLGWLRNDPEAQRDRTLLDKACCAPTKFVRLERAPMPAPLPTFLERRN